MPKIATECKGCHGTDHGHERPNPLNGTVSLPDHDESPKNGKPSTEELLEQLRVAKKQNILQSQRIEELESYLNCIVVLNAKVRELELDASL